MTRVMNMFWFFTSKICAIISGTIAIFEPFNYNTNAVLVVGFGILMVLGFYWTHPISYPTEETQ